MLVRVNVRTLAGALVLVVACRPSPEGVSSKHDGLAVAADVAPEKKETGAPALERDDGAIDALRRMGAFLVAQQTFSVRVESTTDEVLPTGQKLQFVGNVDLDVRRPNRLRADIRSDRKHRRILYDGKSLTLFAERTGYYAQVPAPPTIREMIEQAQERYAIEVPLFDLFAWGSESPGEDPIVSAIDVGPSQMGGADTEHYAYRQGDVDFQIWIETSSTPLPRKLVITTLSEPSQPQHAMLMTWNLSPRLADDAFDFRPPSGALPIRFAENLH